MSIADKIACLISNVITGAVCIALTLFYFEGLSIPKAVPVIGGTQIIGGAISLRIKATLRDYVALSEKTAMLAQVAQEKRLRAAAEATAASYQKRADAAEQAKQAANSKLQKMIEDDRANPDSPADYWSDDELDWLRHH